MTEISSRANLRSLGFNRKELVSQIEIDASAERIWSILTDFSKFPEWNPFFRSASGKLATGEKLNITLHPSGGRMTSFKPTVLRVVPNKELRWIGHLGFSGIFDGEHIFELQSLESSKTLFIQREKFGGILLPFLTGMLRNETARGFAEMNEALKKRAETTRT